MADPFIGEIRSFGFNYAPLGWAQCNGQTMQIAQNSALFAILGTQFGGDGKTTFCLPNLQGRLPMGFGAGPGLTQRNMGAAAGVETVALTTAQMPAHNHGMTAQAANGQVASPEGAELAKGGTQSGRDFLPNNTYASGTATVPMLTGVVGATGSGAAHENRQPFQAVNFCIALQGIFPPRS